MAQQENHHGGLPSFLSQMLRDRNIDPADVAVVVDKAAVSRNPLTRATFSAPSLFHNEWSLAYPSSLSTNHRFNSASVLAPQRSLRDPHDMIAKGNARWSPIGSSSVRTSPISLQAIAIQDLTSTSTSKREMRGKPSTFRKANCKKGHE